MPEGLREMLNRLRETREARGLNQRELAEYAHIAQSTVSELELGKRRPWAKVARRLARVLKTRPEDLFPDIVLTDGDHTDHTLTLSLGTHRYECPRCGLAWEGQDVAMAFSVVASSGDTIYSEAVPMCLRCLARDARQRYGLIVDGKDSRQEEVT